MELPRVSCSAQLHPQNHLLSSQSPGAPSQEPNKQKVLWPCISPLQEEPDCLCISRTLHVTLKPTILGDSSRHQRDPIKVVMKVYGKKISCCCCFGRYWEGKNRKRGCNILFLVLVQPRSYFITFIQLA